MYMRYHVCMNCEKVVKRKKKNYIFFLGVLPPLCMKKMLPGFCELKEISKKEYGELMVVNGI